MNGRTPTTRMALGVLVALAAACGDDGTAPELPTPTTIEIEPAAPTLTAIGEVVRLDATVLDQNGEAMPREPVAWESLHEPVARVTGAGAVAAVTSGTATIEARAGSVGGLATVTVSPVATSVTLEPAADTLNALGDTAALAATVQDPNGTVIADAVVNWESLDEAVATVDDAGRVVAVGPGTAELRATAGETSVEATIVVQQVPASVAVTPASLTLAEGASEALSAVVADSNGAAIEGADVAWSAEETMTATVDGDGLAAGVFQGTTAITASSGGVAGAAPVRVLGRISYSVQGDDGGSPVFETFVMNADGTGVDTLDFLEETDREVVWSPDRSRIAFTSERSGDRDIWVANADGSGTPLNLTSEAASDMEPDWSPDGARIAYRRSGGGEIDIWLSNADGGGTPVNVTDNPFASGDPVWSPDGSAIAFAHEDAADGNLEIAVTNPDAEPVLLQPITNPDSSYYDRQPAWSPDGRSIAFTRGPFGDVDLYVIDVDGTDLRQLTHTPAEEGMPSWSWDGRRIVFVSLRDGNAELYMIDLETGEEERLTNSSAHEVMPRFLPRPGP